MDIGRTVDGVVDDALITGNEYLYLGVSWVPGVPTLDLVEVCSVRHVRVPGTLAQVNQPERQPRHAILALIDQG